MNSVDCKLRTINGNGQPISYHSDCQSRLFHFLPLPCANKQKTMRFKCQHKRFEFQVGVGQMLLSRWSIFDANSHAKNGKGTHCHLRLFCFYRANSNINRLNATSFTISNTGTLSMTGTCANGWNSQGICINTVECLHESIASRWYSKYCNFFNVTLSMWLWRKATATDANMQKYSNYTGHGNTTVGIILDSIWSR